jgi:tetratricopeptide (TPR) repeat protein
MKAAWMARALNITVILLVGFLLAAPHALLAQNIDEAFVLSEQVIALYEKGRYSEAVPLAQRAIAIYEKALGPDHPNVATAVYNLAVLYRSQGRYTDAEALFIKSLAIQEKALGPDHIEVARSLNNLATLYNQQGRYADAEPLYKRSLAIRENALGPDHPDVAATLNNFAILYMQQGRYADAEPLYKRSLAIEEMHGPNDPGVARALNNLAILYQDEGQYADAELFYKRSLAVREKLLGPDHPDVAELLNNLAALYGVQGRYADAEPLYKRSLAIKEKTLGGDDPSIATTLIGLGSVYTDQGHYADAEPLYRRSLTIQEKALGPHHPSVAESLNSLAGLYSIQGRYAEAEPLYKRSLLINETTLGLNHPDVARTLNNLAALYYSEGRYADAEPLYRRSLSINETTLGPDHPDVAVLLTDLALVYESQGRFADAEPLHKRSLTIAEKVFGPDNVHVADTLNGLASLYYDEGRFADSEPLYKRSLQIKENSLGPDHPGIAVSLINLGNLYQVQARYADAESVYKQSLAIAEKALGHHHPNVGLSLNNLASLYTLEGRYADALPLVRTAAQMGFARKSTYLSALTGAVEKSLITNTDAFNEGYQIFQRTTSTAASKAVNLFAARFAVGEDQLARLVRKDQDLVLEGERLDKLIVEAVSDEPSKRDPATEQQIRDRLEAIENERAKINSTLSRQFPGYAALAKPEPLSAQETQQLLADDEALIVFDFDQQSYAAVFTRSDARAFELKITARNLEARIRALRNSLNFAPTFDVEASYRLYHSLVGPFADFISSKKRLSVVMNGALSSLPLQLLVTSDPTGKDLKDIDWLGRKYATTVWPSTASLKILREGKITAIAAKPMIGFGDPIFDRTVQTATKQKVAMLSRSLPEFYRGVTADVKSLAEASAPLPETADELRAVAKELGARSEDIKLGEAATVTDVKHEPLDDYRVLYFATHALVAGEVEKFAKVKAEPALVLSIPDKPTEEDDGLLKASDVAMLKMNADFVVLSACNTAAGDKPGAEALSGLARAFFYAGARSLIVSNWEVDSESTVALMTGLFDALKRDPHLSHAEALRLSMLQMIDHPSKPEWAQPKFWAPFMVVGEPQKN